MWHAELSGARRGAGDSGRRDPKDVDGLVLAGAARGLAGLLPVGHRDQRVLGEPGDPLDVAVGDFNVA